MNSKTLETITKKLGQATIKLLQKAISKKENPEFAKFIEQEYQYYLVNNQALQPKNPSEVFIPPTINNPIYDAFTFGQNIINLRLHLFKDGIRKKIIKEIKETDKKHIVFGATLNKEFLEKHLVEDYPSHKIYNHLLNAFEKNPRKHNRNKKNINKILQKTKHIHPRFRRNTR